MSNDQPQLTVFVSSMIGPLWDERAAVEEAIRTGIPLARTWVFERAPASSEAIAESYLARVRECDVYLLILAALNVSNFNLKGEPFWRSNRLEYGMASLSQSKISEIEVSHEQTDRTGVTAHHRTDTRQPDGWMCW